MKRVLFSLFIIVTFSNALSQTCHLNVKLLDCNKTSFSIQDIKKITFSNALPQTYYLNVKFRDGTKTSFSIQEIKKITFSDITSIGDSEHLQNVIETLMLFQNYPNPFNPTTTIEYCIPKAGRIDINIFNIKGQIVRELSNEYQIAGNYKIIWDGNNNQGNTVTSGVYIYQIKFEKLILCKRMIYIK